MNNTFATQGTCAKFIDFEIEDDRVIGGKFVGGCQFISQHQAHGQE